MDLEERLELIVLLAQSKDWEVVIRIGKILLDHHYPVSVFTGVSGDPGPEYIVALRNALKRIE